MGPLLDTLYNDTKARVETLLNFDNPDSLVTLSTDGWEAPGGIHIRNYVIVADKVTFFHTATSNGTFEERKFKDAEKITALINNTTFWADLHKLRLFLKPLKCFIKLMDHDCHCAHHEYPGELFILSLLLSCLASY